MKHRVFLIAALFAFVLTAASVLLTQKKDESRGGQDEKVRTETKMADEQSRIDAAKFDLQFTITDADGKPLDGVTMELELKRPRLPLIGGEWEIKNEKARVVKPEFRIQEKGWSELILRFQKDGFYYETRHFSINILEVDKSKLMMRQDVQIKLSKQGVRVAMVGSEGTLFYDFENDMKNFCDVDIFPKRKANVTSAKVKEQEENKKIEGEKTEWEDDEEVPEAIKDLQFITIKSNTKPKTSKYIELDFKRNEKGSIVFDAKDGMVSKPTTCVIRFCSDDPDEGLFFADEVHFAKSQVAERQLTLAPEKGYKKEITIDIGKKGDTYCSFVYLKCNGHYGKAIFTPFPVSVIRGKLEPVRIDMSISFNKQEGDRNVTSF